MRSDLLISYVVVVSPGARGAEVRGGGSRRFFLVDIYTGLLIEAVTVAVSRKIGES